jgi:hypothetical protein
VQPLLSARPDCDPSEHKPETPYPGIVFLGFEVCDWFPNSGAIASSSAMPADVGRVETGRCTAGLNRREPSPDDRSDGRFPPFNDDFAQFGWP